MTCYCSAVVTGSVAYVRVLFTAQNNPNCEVQFFVGPTRYCANADEKMYLDGAQMEEIKFEKSFRRDSTACLRLEVKKRKLFSSDITEKYLTVNTPSMHIMGR